MKSLGLQGGCDSHPFFGKGAMQRRIPAILLVGLILAVPAMAEEQSEVKKLKARIQSMEQMLADLKAKVEALEKGEISAAPTTTAKVAEEPESKPAVPTASAGGVSQAIIQRETLNTDTQAAARVDNAVVDPAMKGFFQLPGTETQIRFGGFAKVDVIHDLKPAGDPDQFVTSTLQRLWR